METVCALLDRPIVIVKPADVFRQQGCFVKSSCKKIFATKTKNCKFKFQILHRKIVQTKSLTEEPNMSELNANEEQKDTPIARNTRSSGHKRNAAEAQLPDTALITKKAKVTRNYKANPLLQVLAQEGVIVDAKDALAKAQSLDKTAAALEQYKQFVNALSTDSNDKDVVNISFGDVINIISARKMNRKRFEALLFLDQTLADAIANAQEEYDELIKRTKTQKMEKCAKELRKQQRLAAKQEREQKKAEQQAAKEKAEREKAEKLEAEEKAKKNFFIDAAQQQAALSYKGNEKNTSNTPNTKQVDSNVQNDNPVPNQPQQTKDENPNLDADNTNKPAPANEAVDLTNEQNLQSIVADDDIISVDDQPEPSQSTEQAINNDTQTQQDQPKDTADAAVSMSLDDMAKKLDNQGEEANANEEPTQ